MGNLQKFFVNITNCNVDSYSDELVEISWGGYQYKIKNNIEEIKRLVFMLYSVRVSLFVV